MNSSYTHESTHTISLVTFEFETFDGNVAKTKSELSLYFTLKNQGKYLELRETLMFVMPWNDGQR